MPCSACHTDHARLRRRLRQDPQRGHPDALRARPPPPACPRRTELHPLSLHDALPISLDTAIELGATGIGPGIQGLSLAAAEAVREAGLQLNPWTVNRPEQLDIALACRVDTITTDDPAWLHRELDARGL